MVTIFQKIFGKSTRIKLVEFFVLHPVHKFTTKAVAKGMGLSQNTVRSAIKDLNNDVPGIIINCGTDRYDVWVLNSSDAVVIKFLEILQIEEYR